MKRILLLSVMIMLTQSIFAEIPTGYYDSADGLTGEALKNALHDIIDGHTVKSYSDLWTILKETDEDPNNTDNFILIYTGQSIPKTFVYPAFNREHVWAKSHGFPNESDYGYTDAHHLRPSDVDVNSARGNLDFDNGGTLVSGTTDCYSDGDSWEPRDEVKGDIARMMFYMVVRYEGNGGTNDDYDLELVDYVGTSGTEFGKLSTLLEWHNNDPVDEMDIQRNEVVYSYQNNRNPFIDHPEYVAKIWGGAGVFISNVVQNPTAPKSTDLVNVTADITSADATITTANLKWGTTAGVYGNTIVMSNSGDSYSASIPAQNDGTTVYYIIEAEDDNAETASTEEYSYMVDDNPPIELLNEDFESCPATGWVAYSVASNRDWTCESGYQSVNAYGGDEPSDDWLISPSQDLDSYTDEILTFSSWTRFNDTYYPAIELKYSTDYTGSGDPASANWTTLSATWSAEDSQSWTESGNIDVSGISGAQVYFAFHYTSSGTGSGTSAFWEIDDVKITGKEGASNNVPAISNIQILPSSPTDADNVTVTATITDSDGTVSSAKIKWGTSTGVYSNEVTMTKLAGDYSGEIPVQTEGTTVYFVIEATDNEAESNTSSENSYTVQSSSVSSEIFFEDFETSTEDQIIDINGWTTYIQVGTRTWEGRLYLSNKYAQMSAYQSGEASNITWLITPEIDLTNSISSTFSFKSKDGYNNGDPLEVFISTDFSGTGDPNSANWTQLNPTIATGTSSGYATNFTESGDVDITDYCGNNVYIAYVYTGGDPSLTTTIQIDDILIIGEENQNPTVTNVSNDPTTPLQNEDVTISATITDDGTITSTKIKWGTSSGTYNNVDTLTYLGSNDIFTGVISAQPAETTVYYLIEAKDNLGGSFRSDEYTYTVAENQLPVITEVDKSPEIITDADDIAITATISDSDGTISSATIKWGTSEGGPYSNTISMGNVGDAYSGIITAQAGGTNIHYVIEAIDNNGGSTRSEEESFTVNTTGNSNPVISNLLYNPTDPESSEAVTVTATITDSDDAISSAKIKWGTETDSYDNEVIMTNTDDDYSGEIPAQEDGIHVYFIVEARDGSGGVTKSAEQDYVVFDPNVLPEISGVSFDPASPESDEDVRVSATIADTDGTIDVAQVKWGTTTGTYPNTITMDGTDNDYLGTIPMQADGTHIYFIIYAEDNEGATAQSDEFDYIVDDLIQPEISGIALDPVSPTENDAVSLTATISDSDGTIENAELHWGISSGSLTNTISMSVSSEETYITSSNIPSQTVGTIVYYEIEVTDNDDLVATQTGNYTVSSSDGIITLTDSQLKIYPNPTSDKLYIKVENEDYLKSVIVYNLIGEKIIEMNDLNSASCTINFNDYPKGIYIVQIQGENNLNVKKILHK